MKKKRRFGYTIRSVAWKLFWFAVLSSSEDYDKLSGFLCLPVVQ